jgi:hypothetical protein
VWGREGGPPLPHPTPRPGRDVGVGMLTGETAESSERSRNRPLRSPICQQQGLVKGYLPTDFGPKIICFTHNNDILYIP